MLKQGCTNPSRIYPRGYILYDGALYFYTLMEVPSYHPPGAYNFRWLLNDYKICASLC
jgi:hypothetical protein